MRQSIDIERGDRDEPADTAGRDWPGGVGAITLFVEDLADARNFYRDVFGFP